MVNNDNDNDKRYTLSPKGHLLGALMDVFENVNMDLCSEVWDRWNASIYRASGKIEHLKDAEFIGIILDGHGGEYLPLHRNVEDDIELD